MPYFEVQPPFNKKSKLVKSLFLFNPSVPVCLLFLFNASENIISKSEFEPQTTTPKFLF